MAQTAVVSNTPFLWEGTDRNGKKIKGKSLASDEATVRADLRRQAIDAYDSLVQMCISQEAYEQAQSYVQQQGQGLEEGGGLWHPQPLRQLLRQRPWHPPVNQLWQCFFWQYPSQM